MARKIDDLTGSAPRRTDTFFVDPEGVEVDWQLNGRTDTFTAENIARLAADMEANGQLQPIGCVARPGGRLKIVYGYNRLRAALLLRKSNPAFRLEVKVYDGLNERDAFLLNIRENMIRNDVSPVDNANNVRKLLNNYGFVPGEVAELYKRSITWVKEMLALLTLPETAKAALAAGDLGASTGLMLTKLPESDAAEIVAAAVAAADAEEAAEGADAGEGAEPDLTVDDAALAAAIGNLPARPKPAAGGDKARPKKAKRDLTPAEIQSRKTVRQANINAKVRKEAEKKGVRVAKGTGDLARLLKGRQDEISIKLLGFFTGEVSGDELIEAFDRCESPVIDTKGQKPLRAARPAKAAAPAGPVTKL